MSTIIRVQEKSVSTDPEQLDDVSAILYYCETIYCIVVFNEALIFLYKCIILYQYGLLFFNRFRTLLARPRRLPGASHPGGTSQPKSHIHQGGYL